MDRIRGRRRLPNPHAAARAGSERSTLCRTGVGIVAALRQPSGLRHAVRGECRGTWNNFDNCGRSIIAGVGPFGLGAGTGKLLAPAATVSRVLVWALGSVTHMQYLR